MRRTDRRDATFATFVCVLAATLLAGCGGGGGGKSAGTASQNSPPTASKNSAPTIQGQPGRSVVPGQAYSFQPAASDADGDSLTFTAANLPAWATLNASTGRISGTPAAADVATYSSITVTVSDGTATASLAPFAITVSAAGAGAATLSWVAPTQNSDGSTLTNLAGYEVQYGRDASGLDQKVSLSNPSLNTYVIDNLSSGTWYFAVVAVNSSGVASPLSNVASKTIG